MILQQLSGTTSRLEKERILKSATPLELKMFRYAYDKALAYGIKFKEICEVYSPVEEDFEFLDLLASGRLRGNAARMMAEAHCEEHGDLIKLICNKDLDCGVTSTLVNKVHPGTVNVFKCQLAKEVPLAKVQFPCYAEIKYDGVRIVIVNQDGEATFRTRNGKFVRLPQLKKELESKVLKNYILDTEVTLASGSMEDRTKVSGMINSAMKGGVIKESSLVFNVFDYMEFQQFITQANAGVYIARRELATSAVATLACSQLQLATAHFCKSAEEAHTLFTDVLEQGMEGLILKEINSAYTFKRSADWVKMKAIKTADLACIREMEGTGKYEGMLGAISCEGIVEGKAITVNVGSGFSDADRSLEDSHYVGETIEVKYNAVIKDKVTGRWSLFLPRFVSIRFDK